jgi:photosystem II stability/assembly factor-like uncharacterized protein
MLSHRSIGIVITLVILPCFVYAQSTTGWKEIKLPSVTARYTQIDFTDSLNGWIFSDSGTFVITQNGGLSWRIDSIPAFQGKVAKISLTAPGKGWVLGDNGLLKPIVMYYTKDYGNTWIQRTLSESTNANLSRTVSFIDDTSFVFCVTKVNSNPRMYITRDGGVTYDTLPFNFANVRGFVSSICFRDLSTGFIGGGGDFGIGYLYRTTDSGKTWKPYLLQDDLVSALVKFYSVRNGYFFLTYFIPDMYYGVFEMTTDGGNTVKGFPSSYNNFGVYYSDSDYIVLTGDESVVKDKNDAFFQLKLLSPVDTNYYSKIISFEATIDGSMWILGKQNKLFERIPTTTQVVRELQIYPAKFELRQNYPNPFNNSTTIELSAVTRQYANLFITDILGRRVFTLLEGELVPGNHVFKWDGKNRDGIDLSSGVYFLILRSTESTIERKLILLR